MDLTNFDLKPPPPKPEKEKPKYTADDAIAEARANLKMSAQAQQRIEPIAPSLAEMGVWLKEPGVGEWATRIALTDGLMTVYITKDAPVSEPLGDKLILVKTDSFQVILALDRISMLSIEQGRAESHEEY